MICYNCGTKLNSDETVCPACGRKQDIPQSLLDDAKKGDRNSIIGLYNYSYASVYETVEAYLSEEDEIQNMIRKIYLDAFQRMEEIPDADQFRPFLHKVALEYLANRTPIEKDASPGWLIIPDTQTLRQILSGLTEYMQEQAHRAAELELMKKYNLDADDEPDYIDETEDAPDEQSEMEPEIDWRAEREAAKAEWEDSSAEQSDEDENEEEDEDEDENEEEDDSRPLSGNLKEDDLQWDDSSEDIYNSKKSTPGRGLNDEESLEKALSQVASSANEDWASLGFVQPNLEEDEEMMRPFPLPLILGIILAVVAVVVVVILAIGALGSRGDSDSEKQYAAVSESQSQSDDMSESQNTSETQSDSETETDENLVDMIENILETEEVTETESTETEIDATGNLLMSDDIPLDEEDAVVLGNDDVLRSEVGTVTFLDTLADAPEDAWDVSENGDGLVMAWVVLDESSDLYDLYIAGEGGIYANEDSAYFFAFYDSAASITFNGCFYTQNATDMSGMFYECALVENLDLSDFDTSAVTNMSYMFYDCVSLTDVNVSSFNTSETTAMSYMFTSCESLTELSLDGFDFANVTEMEYIFAGCSSLESLSIDMTNAADEANTEGMYEGTSLE